jgi:type VI secretion system secreted protein VgrG
VERLAGAAGLLEKAMPSPKDGQAGSAVEPTAPKSPQEADNADPGAVATLKAEQREKKKGKYGSVSLAPHKPPQTDEEKEKQKSWIEVKLVDKSGKPVPGEPCDIVLADNTLWSGTLDENGFVRVDGIPPGQCKVSFPRRDKSCYKKK